jgi:hypothetical protein
VLANESKAPVHVRVGVTGHRVLTDIGRIVSGVRRAIETIQRAYADPPLTVVSSLAEGADRIVVEEVLRTPGACLVVALPFSLHQYTRDFGPSESPSRAQFDNLLGLAGEIHVVAPVASRAEGYALAGEYVLEHCDVLLAVWDGRPSQGRGGTAEIVQRARTLGKPLVIVRAGNRRPETGEPTTLGAQQGQVQVERLLRRD